MLWRGSRKLYHLVAGSQNNPNLPIALKLARTSDPSQVLELLSTTPNWKGSAGFCLRAIARSLKNYKMPHSVLTDTRYIALKHQILSHISELNAQETCDVVFWMRVMKEQGRQNVNEVMEDDKMKLAARIKELAETNTFINRQLVSLLYDLSSLDLSLPSLEERLLLLLKNPNESFTFMELKQVLYVLYQWRFHTKKLLFDSVFKRLIQEGLERVDLVSILEVHSAATNMKQIFHWESLDLLVLHCQDALFRRFDSMPEFGLRKIMVQFLSHPIEPSAFAFQLYKRLETFLSIAPMDFHLELMHYFAKLTLLHPEQVPARFLATALERFPTDFKGLKPSVFEYMIFNLASLNVVLSPELIAGLEDYGANHLSPGLWTICLLKIKSKSDTNFLSKYAVPEALESSLLALLPYQQLIAYSILLSFSHFPSSPALRKLTFLMENKVKYTLGRTQLGDIIKLLTTIDEKGRVNICKQINPVVSAVLSTLERCFPDLKLENSLKFLLRVFPNFSIECKAILQKHAGDVDPRALSTFMRTNISSQNFPELMEILLILQEKTHTNSVLNALKDYNPNLVSVQAVETFQTLLNRQTEPILVNSSFFTHLETIFQIIKTAPRRSLPFCQRLVDELKSLKYPSPFSLKVFYRLSAVYDTSSFQSKFVHRALVRCRDVYPQYIVLLSETQSFDILESLPVLKSQDSKFEVVDKAKAVLKTGDKNVMMRFVTNAKKYVYENPIDFGVDFLKEISKEKHGKEMATELLTELMRKLSIFTPSIPSQITLLRISVDLSLQKTTEIERLAGNLSQVKWFLTKTEVESIKEMIEKLGCDSKDFSDSI